MKNQQSPNGWVMLALGIIPLLVPMFLVLYVTQEKFRVNSGAA